MQHLLNLRKNNNLTKKIISIIIIILNILQIHFISAVHKIKKTANQIFGLKDAFYF